MAAARAAVVALKDALVRTCGAALEPLTLPALALALRHASAVNEMQGALLLGAPPPLRRALLSNERLEFLGDAALDCAVSRALFLADPCAPEGLLTKRRALVVCEAAEAAVAARLGLPAALAFGAGAATEVRHLPSVACGALEAVAGAVYLDCGPAGVEALVAAAMAPELAAANAWEPVAAAVAAETASADGSGSSGGLDDAAARAYATKAMAHTRDASPGSVTPAAAAEVAVAAAAAEAAREAKDPGAAAAVAAGRWLTAVCKRT